MTLQQAGHRTSSASTFESAKQSLAQPSTDVLITDVRLGAFNGLHLALRRHLDQSQSASIITSSHPDRFLEKEALQIRAPFLLKPLRSLELLTVIEKIVSGTVPADALRRWSRRRFSTPYSAVVNESPVSIIDVSDDGICVELPDPIRDAAVSFRVAVPAAGVSCAAEVVWSKRDKEAGTIRYGATVQRDASKRDDWRAFVDSVR
jgi:hypothetical protein